MFRTTLFRTTLFRSTLSRSTLFVAASTALWLLASPPVSAKERYAEGEIVRISGQVNDASGDPVVGVRVVFEASRKAYSFTRMRRLRYHPVTIEAETDRTGQYRFDWKWHPYYNTFSVSAVVGVRRPGGKVDDDVLADLDLTKRLKQGPPVLGPLVIADTKLLVALRRFEAEIDTNDERRVYREQGKPDRVEVLELAEGPEEAWWYFELGTIYRFQGGRLNEVETFDPVRGFEG